MRRRGERRGAVVEGILTPAPATPAGYHRVDGALVCEGVSLQAIAHRVGTPAYVYSAASIRGQVARLRAALAGLPVRLYYSAKANPNLAVLALLRSLGAGVDIVSAGELYRALQAGFVGGDVVFSGVGKSRAEITEALRAGVHTVNVENPAELEVVQQAAAELGLIAPVLLRVNPDVDVDTPHPYTRTGAHGMKFGIPHDQIVPLARRCGELPNLRLLGLAAHLGSQIADARPYALAVRELEVLADAIEADGVTRLRVFDVGGGLGVRYGTEPELDLAAYAAALRPLARRDGVTIAAEPGRFLVAEAGALLASVLYRKHSGGKEILITDAGMNDLLRPALYHAEHRVEAVESGAPATLVADVVGPVCESGDFLARDRMVPDVGPGALLAIRTVGAYGASMASTYNSRPRAAEVLVDGDRWALVARRERPDELVQRESVTLHWSEI